MHSAHPDGDAVDALGDFTASRRLILISVLAVGIGLVGALLARGLLALIALSTNLFFFGRFSTADVSPADSTLGPLIIAVPVIGGLLVGVMARYGSERIRGHGIPEAIEAILMNGSRVQPRVALLKPLSSAIAIGSGGPFGAEGPIIMTDGAFGSVIAQFFRLTSAERKTLLVAGAAAGMSATFAAPVAAVLLAVELLLFEWKPRSLVPVALASAAAAAGDKTATLATILRPTPTVAHPDEPLRIVVHRMADTGLTHFPVVERGPERRLTGMISLEDLLKARTHHLESERRASA